MPGASLWIIPPKDSSFSQALQTLISTTIPPHFPNTKTHDFIPHVTITSNIDQSLYGTDPQAWLSSLHLPSGDQHDPVFVTLDVLEAGDAFVKKLTLRAGKTAQLSDVEKLVSEIQEDCRKAGRSVEAHDDGTVANGGSIVLVDTSKPIDQWKSIATRALPYIRWEWPWSKSRFDD
ncbi:unnamed protein product [Aureobasidium vineae]|uniref:2, 3 cyclic phosphodiesterase n=1 Tax=Aureobasidium vineae TaxID=2773715 RepID=A0A9N8P675_9PEZI|nr:unnamed protein product [Aureobasidium vineae]